MSSSRMQKINEAIHRGLAKLISLECMDPRLGMVTISEVKVSKDLSVANIFVTVLENEKVDQTLKALKSASGFLRSRLSQEIASLRRLPSLNFRYDPSVVNSNKINSILCSLGPSLLEPDLGI